MMTLLLDEGDAMAAVPAMLARDRDLSRRMFAGLHRMIDAVALRTDAAKARWVEIEHLFKDLEQRKAAADNGRNRPPPVALRRVHLHPARGGGKHQ